MQGTIHITVSSSENEITLIYQDNGKGIKKEYLKKIYEPFFTTNREGGGTGLGLNIIYSLVNKKLNGTIACKSEEGHGVEFTIILPKVEVA
jgi:signal transduction histidine kinase